MPASRFVVQVLALTLVLSSTAVRAAEGVVRIGYQKYGNLILLKTHGGLDDRLKRFGLAVTWTEFPSGPPLLEALNAGAIDIGQTGEAPPIFAQAAGAPLLYIANEPAAPRGEAILVPRSSPLHGVSELKGKRVALNKGSNVHFLLVRALENAGVAYHDIEPVFLAPADARAAFEQGAVDAWAIWDPYLAAAQAATGARTLATGEGIAPNIQFYFAARTFAEAHPAAVAELIAALADTDRWAFGNPDAVARELAGAIRLPETVIATALARQTYGVAPLSADVVASQQKVADTFRALGLIPVTLSVADVVWRPGP